jgi:hypothetical protein
MSQCAECGCKAAEGWALYCVKCSEANMNSEILRLQDLTAKTSRMEHTILRLQELADYRLKLLTKMPSERSDTMSIEAMRQALDALNTTDTHPISSAEQYDKEIRAMEALEDAIADAEEVTVDWEAVAADQALTIALMKQREWVGLTDEEIADLLHPLVVADLSDEQTDYEIARAIEAKLKEKNT